MSGAVEPLTALVLAGTRPGRDPLLEGTSLQTKALLPIAGQPMLLHVLGSLRQSARLGTIVVATQDPHVLRSKLNKDHGSSHVRWVTSCQSIAQTLLSAIDAEQETMLVTTADNVLLSSSMVDDFLLGAGGADLAVAVVERRVLRATGLPSARTWLRFRGGAYSGANLFLVTPRARPFIEKWAAIEQARKKGWKLLSAFGPVVLLGALLRLITVGQAARTIGRRFNLDLQVFALRQGEACIDADKPADVVLIEQVLAARAA